MGDDNRELLEKLLADTIEYCDNHPEDLKAKTNLAVLLKAASNQYQVTMDAWNKEQEIANEHKIRERELELKEQELEETKKYHRGDIISKLAGTAAATTTAVLAIKWESVGEFIHNVALKIGPKFRS